MKLAKFAPLLLFLAIALPGLTQAGRGRDPLNEKEVDELRETAQEPDKRLKLMVKFARARMASIEQVRGDAKLEAGRGQQIHDMLDEFTALMDEVDDNIDDYTERHADLRKPLKELIEADNEFQLKLRALKEQAPPKEATEYAFVLQNAIEAVNANLDNARKTLDEQELEFKNAKKKKE
jgi:hypothetical protein